jgi:hypothetical protein
MEDLFSEETKQLQLIVNLVEPNIEFIEFVKVKNDIYNIITKSFKSVSNDIEDLGDQITLIDLLIQKLFISKENLIKFNSLVDLRLKAKKYANSKYREGYDWLYSEQIKKGFVEKKIKYTHEIPREFWNVEECEIQYFELIEHVWKPSTYELTKLTDKLVCK